MVPQREPVSPAELAKQGIKARDFAYESTLPPIRSSLLHQVQPGLPLKKRVRDSGDDSNPSGSNSKRPRALSRVPTEVFEEEESQPTSRSRGLIGHRQDPRFTPLTSQSHTSTNVGVIPSKHAPSTPRLKSQNSDIDTPPVSPSGSFRNLPMDIVSTDYQLIRAGKIVKSHPQLGFIATSSQANESQTIASLPSTPLARPSLSIVSKHISRLTRQTSSLIRRTSGSILSSAPRYYLRARKTINYYVNSKPRSHARGSPNLKRTVRKAGKA